MVPLGGSAAHDTMSPMEITMPIATWICGTTLVIPTVSRSMIGDANTTRSLTIVRPRTSESNQIPEAQGLANARSLSLQGAIPQEIW
jgi:hypothetical protein